MPDALDRLKAALADRYTIEREIGVGGMATVYLAQDFKRGRTRRAICAPTVPQTPTNSPIQDLTRWVRPPPEVPNSRQLERTPPHSRKVDFVNS